jgi:hypothetical protein
MSLNDIIDTNLMNTTSVGGTLVVNLSTFVQAIARRLGNVRTDNLATALEFNSLNLDLTTIYTPLPNFSRFYELDKFNANYSQAFGTNFPTRATSRLLFGVDLNIVNNLPFSTRRDWLFRDELAAFRLITCLLFGLTFNVTLDECVCYPKNLSELKSVNAGIGLNCVNMACRNWLRLDPLKFDDLVHTDCDNIAFNAAFVTLDLLAAKSISINLEINQVQTLGSGGVESRGRGGKVNNKRTRTTTVDAVDLIRQAFPHFNNHQAALFASAITRRLLMENEKPPPRTIFPYTSSRLPTRVKCVFLDQAQQDFPLVRRKFLPELGTSVCFIGIVS